MKILDKAEKLADLQAKRTSRRYKDIAALDDKSPRVMTFEQLVLSIDRSILLEEAVSWYGLLMSSYRKGIDAHKLPRRIARNIKYFYQRGTRGFSDADTWNLSHYYANVIANSLEHMRDHSTGYPALKEWDELTPDQRYEQWQRELTMIAEGFRHHSKDMDNTVPEETWKKFQYFFNSLWD